MVDLSKTINRDTFIISDTHLGHYRVLQFEPVRVEFLLHYNSSVAAECKELLALFESVPTEERRNNSRCNDLCKYLIDFHDQMIYDKWNNQVSEDDTVLHLGDFAFSNLDGHIKKLNGKKILLRGNHDLKSKYTYTDAGFADVIESFIVIIGEQMFEMTPSPDKYWNGLITDINGWKILFSHYPIKNSNAWDLKRYGQITDMLEKVYEATRCDLNIYGHTHSKTSIYEKSISVCIETNGGNMSPLRIGDVLAANHYYKK